MFLGQRGALTAWIRGFGLRCCIYFSRIFIPKGMTYLKASSLRYLRIWGYKVEELRSNKSHPKFEDDPSIAG